MLRRLARHVELFQRATGFLRHCVMALLWERSILVVSSSSLAFTQPNVLMSIRIRRSARYPSSIITEAMLLNE
jgi:hypothetical protein